MRLDWLFIEDWRNLRSFRIDFDKDSFATVVVGRNGTGKSNVLEALITIFRDLDRDLDPAFTYKIAYRCRDRYIIVDAESDAERARENNRSRYEFTVDDEAIPRNEFMRREEDGRNVFLPAHVFGYYSGLSTRMAELFDWHQDAFYDVLIENKRGQARLKKAPFEGDATTLRPFFYARPEHSSFVLLSFLLDDAPEVKELMASDLRVESIGSTLFVIREPMSWKSREGDKRFWNARGTVQRFLDALYKTAFVPLRIDNEVRLTFRKSTRKEHLFLYLPTIDALRHLADNYPRPQEFFKALESTFVSELLGDIHVPVGVRGTRGKIKFRDLSEGEQQLLTVLGLMRFTQEDESLFLLDEPDTHLNPLWSIRYLEFVEKFVGKTVSSHVIMTTHNPLVLTALNRQQVQILLRHDETTLDGQTSRVTAVTPNENPKDMDVESILTTESFGLRSTFGVDVQRDIEKRRELSLKSKLNFEEKQLLQNLNHRLENLEWRIDQEDPSRPLYERFFAAMLQQEKKDPVVEPDGLALTPEEVERRRKIAQRVLDRLRNQMNIPKGGENVK